LSFCQGIACRGVTLGQETLDELLGYASRPKQQVSRDALDIRQCSDRFQGEAARVRVQRGLCVE
jgi:hypothetical protein